MLFAFFINFVTQCNIVANVEKQDNHTADGTLETNTNKRWQKEDLYYAHSHHTTHAIRAQRAKAFVDKDEFGNVNQSDNETVNDDENEVEKGNDKSDSSNYYNIAENIDGGLVSNWVFLPFNQWCTSNIEYHTDQADQLLSLMKQEAYKSNSDVFVYFYNETNKQTNKQTNEQMEYALSNLPSSAEISLIDNELSYESKTLGTLLKVQRHTRSIQSQFDTFVDNLRGRQIEILEMSKELKERHHICSQTLQRLTEQEVWLIQNITETIAERAEKIDRLNKQLKRHDVHQSNANNADTNTNTNNGTDRVFVEAELMNTRAFVDQLHKVIVELQQISEGKKKEVNALENDSSILQSQNAKIREASSNASKVAMERLTESILNSIDTLVSNAKSRDTYSKAMELWQSCAIFSDQQNKVFFNEYVSLCCQAFIDASLATDYISSNNHDNGNQNNWFQLGSRLNFTSRTSVTENDLPTMSTVSKQTEKMYELIKQSHRHNLKGLDLVMNLSEVFCREISHDVEYKQNKEIYDVAVRPHMTSHYFVWEIDLQSQKNELDNMLDRIIILGKYYNKIQHLEAVLACIGQY
ncbi:hypothetical protein RFI_26981, partial [Reticulomyxa filosa]